jgi:hypothetical protein
MTRLDVAALDAAYAAVPAGQRDKNVIASAVRAYVDSAEWASDYIDRLNALCEKHGCEPGTDRLFWLDTQLSRISEQRQMDDRPGGFDGPTGAD